MSVGGDEGVKCAVGAPQSKEKLGGPVVIMGDELDGVCVQDIGTIVARCTSRCRTE